MKKTSGIADVLREALEPVRGRIASAFVYGSIARGDELRGSDLDLMVIGEVKLGDVVEALQDASNVLRRGHPVRTCLSGDHPGCADAVIRLGWHAVVYARGRAAGCKFLVKWLIPRACGAAGWACFPNRGRVYCYYDLHAYLGRIETPPQHQESRARL